MNSWGGAKRTYIKHFKKWKIVPNACVFDLVQVFSDDLSLPFYNQGEINSEDWYKMKLFEQDQDQRHRL